MYMCACVVGMCVYILGHFPISLAIINLESNIYQGFPYNGLSNFMFIYICFYIAIDLGLICVTFAMVFFWEVRE